MKDVKKKSSFLDEAERQELRFKEREKQLKKEKELCEYFDEEIKEEEEIYNLKILGFRFFKKKMNKLF